jgi:glycosyltransferase involved in cell wall biosynthesis
MYVQGLRERDHSVTIFAPFLDDKVINDADSRGVIRCFNVNEYDCSKYGESDGPWIRTGGALNPEPFLDQEYDFFVAQGFNQMSRLDEFKRIFPEIKRKSKTIYVVHEYSLEHSSFADFDWDETVVFDERYLDFVSKAFPRNRINIIPYPCYPVSEGNQEEARQSLGLPLDKKIILSYGWRLADYTQVFPIVEGLSRESPLVYLMLTREQLREKSRILRSQYQSLHFEFGKPDIKGIYQHLHAADLLLINKRDSEGDSVVLSSAAHMCMGSLTPIVANNTSFFALYGSEIIKFSDHNMLGDVLRETLYNDDFVQSTRSHARQYVESRSPQKVAARLEEIMYK